MDLIFKRYSDPLSFLSQLILTDSLSNGIIHIYQQINDEKTWEFYLQKIQDKTYDEFVKELEAEKNIKRKMSKIDIEATVNRSKSMLDKFIPNV